MFCPRKVNVPIAIVVVGFDSVDDFNGLRLLQEGSSSSLIVFDVVDACSGFLCCLYFDLGLHLAVEKYLELIYICFCVLSTVTFLAVDNHCANQSPKAKKLPMSMKLHGQF